MEFNIDNRSTSLTQNDFVKAQAILKYDLDSTRLKIDELRRQGKGRQFTTAVRAVNPYEDMEHKSVLPQISSRAFYKMYEILKRYKPLERFSSSSSTLKTLHLCEAPGSFVEATQEYVQRVLPSHTLEWYGVTLPVSNNGLEWKTSLTGEDSNVIFADVIKDSLPTKVSGSVLVTGDGGFEIESKDRNDQEICNTPLLRGQLYQSYKALCGGGCMVIKMFDMFSLETCDLLWDCFLRFDKVYVIKPFGSRICNSEKYIVGIGFNPKNTEPRNGVNDIIPSWFYGSVWNISRRFTQLQIQSLEKAIVLVDTLVRSGPLPDKFWTKKKLQVDEAIKWLGLD